MLIAGAMFTLGAVIQAFAPDTVILVAGRLVVGAGVGVAAVAAPLYAAELAPTAVARPFRFLLPARDHDRHFPCLSGRWLAVGEGRVAR